MVDHWEDRFMRRPGWTAMWLTGGIIAFFLVVGGVLWATGVILSPVKGAGEAYAEKNGAGNFIEAQHAFQAENQDFEATLAKIKDARDVVAKDQTAINPAADPIAQWQVQQRVTSDAAILTELTQGCQNTAAKYNTDANSYLTASFRDAGLPDHLDPATCSASR